MIVTRDVEGSWVRYPDAMRITITAGGSRGDVQPLVALGLGFQAAGDEVRVAAPVEFEGLVRERGLGFAPVSGDPRQLIGALLRGGLNPIAFMRAYKSAVGPILECNLKEYTEACVDANAIVFGPLGFWGSRIAEKFGLPSAGAFVQPLFSRTRYFRSSFSPPLTDEAGSHGLIDSMYNRASYHFIEQLSWQTFRFSINRISREVLGLPPISPLGFYRRSTARGDMLLHGWSPSVLPHPPDWARQLRTTGYWFLDRPEAWTPPDRLSQFIEGGSPPVSVGFGSMNNTGPEELIEMVLKALRRTGRRGIFLTGWGGIGPADLPDDVIRVEEVPHDWLLPRVAAAVHHGGAGTCAAALRAGTPSVTIPFFADQLFWGSRLASLGTGSAPIRRKRLTVENLSLAIERAWTDASLRRRARLVGEKIRSEDGVGVAVSSFHEHARTWRP